MIKAGNKATRLKPARLPRIIDRGGLGKEPYMTGNLSLDLELTVAFCFVVGFGIAWALVSWCHLDEHEY